MLLALIMIFMVLTTDPQLEESRAHDNEVNEDSAPSGLTMTQMITETTATCPSGMLLNLWIFIYVLVISKVSSNFVLQIHWEISL